MTETVFLTFDMDWASDEVLGYFYDFMCDLEVPYEINVTHNTPMIETFRKNSLVELGIHPNFNFLLSGQPLQTEDNYKKIVNRLKELIPEAVTARSHSLTCSSQIESAFAEAGLKYDLNLFYPPIEGGVVKTFQTVNKITKIPFIHEDDIYILSDNKVSIEFYLSDKFVAPRVFNMHPIHIYLNTNDINLYVKAKPYLKDFNRLKPLVNVESYGTRNFLQDLVYISKRNGFIFKRIKDGIFGDH